MRKAALTFGLEAVRPVLLLVSFPRPLSPVVGVPGLCWMWHGVLGGGGVQQTPAGTSSTTLVQLYDMRAGGCGPQNTAERWRYQGSGRRTVRTLMADEW